jgi:hypothetical protein
VHSPTTRYRNLVRRHQPPRLPLVQVYSQRFGQEFPADCQLAANWKFLPILAIALARPWQVRPQHAREHRAAATLGWVPGLRFDGHNVWRGGGPGEALVEDCVAVSQRGHEGKPLRLWSRRTCCPAISGTGRVKHGGVIPFQRFRGRRVLDTLGKLRGDGTERER